MIIGGFGIWGIIIVFALGSWLVSRTLKKKFERYAKIPTSSGLSGAEIASKMLQDYRISDVQIINTPGELTDHYDPRNKTINLSEEVYYGRHVTAAAVAAHETGHALQHAQAYAALELRSTLVPIANMSGRIMNIIFIAGFLGAGLLHMFPYSSVLWVIVFAQAALTAFSLITLPVEFDASNRALAWLNASKIAQGEEYDGAVDALKWAAGTYVVAALSSITMLLYYVLQLTGSRD